VRKNTFGGGLASRFGSAVDVVASTTLKNELLAATRGFANRPVILGGVRKLEKNIGLYCQGSLPSLRLGQRRAALALWRWGRAGNEVLLPSLHVLCTASASRWGKAGVCRHRDGYFNSTRKASPRGHSGAKAIIRSLYGQCGHALDPRNRPAHKSRSSRMLRRHRGGNSTRRPALSHVLFSFYPTKNSANGDEASDLDDATAEKLRLLGRMNAGRRYYHKRRGINTATRCRRLLNVKLPHWNADPAPPGNARPTAAIRAAGGSV